MARTTLPSRMAGSIVGGGRILTFIAPGDPIGKPRQTRRDRWRQRPCVMEYRHWADRLREVVGTLPEGPPVRVDITAHFAIPPSWSAARKAAAAGKAHQHKPDLDNIVKAVLDALWPDGDQAIAWVVARKLWAGEGEREGCLTLAIHYDQPKEGGAK